MKNNQIGIVGVGYWGTNILNVLHKIGIKNIYCYDNNIKNLKEVKKKFPKIKILKNFQDFLNINFLGVIIAVDTKLHFQIAKKCLNRGFNIFVEKPVTNSSKKLIKTNGGMKTKMFDPIDEGGRNNELTRRAGYLLGHKKYNPDVARNILLQINHDCCNPPLPEKEVLSIVRSISKRHSDHG